MATTQNTKTKWAREYETIYILQPQVDPDEADRIQGRVAEVVDRLQGKLTKVDNWGKRKLAYPIRKHTRGVFVYTRYVGFGDMVAEVERNLRMLDAVIRHQTILVNPEIDPTTVNIDPEEIKFRRLEQTQEEEEPGLEARLGMLEEPRREPVEAASADEGAETAEAEGGADADASTESDGKED